MTNRKLTEKLSRLAADTDAVIFDLDNTILDSHNAWHEVDTEFFRRRDLTEPDDYGRKVACMTFREAAEYTISRFCLDETVQQLTAEWYDLIQEQYSHELKIFGGVRELLCVLKNMGVKIALATASAERLYAAALKNNGIYEYFSCFASTEETQRGKGFPDVYLLAADRAGVPPERCIAFEDIPIGIRAAKSCGMKTVAFLNPYTVREHKELSEIADLSFSDYYELMEK